MAPAFKAARLPISLMGPILPADCVHLAQLSALLVPVQQTAVFPAAMSPPPVLASQPLLFTSNSRTQMPVWLTVPRGFSLIPAVIVARLARMDVPLARTVLATAFLVLRSKA